MLFQCLLYSKVNQVISPLFFRFSFNLVHHRTLNRVPCAMQQILTSYLLYTQCVYVNPHLSRVMILASELIFKGLSFNSIKCLSILQIHRLAFILLILPLPTLEYPFLSGKFLLIVKILIQKYHCLKNVLKCLIQN